MIMHTLYGAMEGLLTCSDVTCVVQQHKPGKSLSPKSLGSMGKLFWLKVFRPQSVRAVEKRPLAVRPQSEFVACSMVKRNLSGLKSWRSIHSGNFLHFDAQVELYTPYSSSATSPWRTRNKNTSHETRTSNRLDRTPIGVSFREMNPCG